MWRYNLEGRDPAAVGKQARDAGLKIVSLCRGGFFPASTADERQKALDDNRLAIEQAHHETEGGEPLLATSVTLSRLRMTDRALARLLVRHPFVTHKTIGLIHLHALRLWRRGVRFHHHGEATR